MEPTSDRYESYLRLIVFVAALIACAAQITSSMTLLDELACRFPEQADPSEKRDVSSGNAGALCMQSDGTATH